MKNKLFGVIWLTLSGIWCQAQIATVRDKEGGESLEGVTLSCDNPRAFSTTNGAGEVDMAPFKGAEHIVIRMIGFTTLTISYQDAEKEKFQLFLEPAGLSLDRVVISATRWDQESREVPSRMTRVSAADVALQNPQTAADLLGASGEVFVQKSQQGGGSPMIRGFSTNRLLYAIDGVRMNTAIFRSGNLQNVISLDPFAMENTEILFGPGSVIYGSDAIGGVMSFQTLTPQLEWGSKNLISGKAVTRYSSANQEKTVHFDMNLGWKKWAMVTSFTSNDFGDLKMGRYGPDEYLRPFYVQRQDSMDVIVSNDDPLVQRPSGYSQINMMQKVRFRPNEKWDFQYGFHYSVTSSYSRYDRHIRYKNGLPRYGEWSYGPQEWMMNLLSATHTANNRVYEQMSIRVAQQFFRESRMDRDINKWMRHIRIEEVDAFSLNIDFRKSWSKRHQLYYGVEAVQNDVVSKGIDEDIKTDIASQGPSRYPQADWASYGAYLNYVYLMSKEFTVQAGARYNQYSLDARFDTTFHAFPFASASLNRGGLTGSLGFVYTPTEKWALSANLSSGFRAPNVDDMGKVFDSEPGAVTVPNPSLEAEYAYNAEIGLAKVFRDKVKLDFSAYYTLLNNAMVRRDYLLNGQDSMMYDGNLSRVQAIQNAAVATVYGVQAGIEIKLPAHFGFASEINYQVGEEELDDGSTSPSRHAPPTFGVSKLMYTTRNLTVQFYAVYSAERTFDDLPEEEKGKTEIYAMDANGDPWSPSWYTLNLKSVYRMNESLAVSAGLENITDQRYRPYSSGIVAPGRNVVLSFTAHF